MPHAILTLIVCTVVTTALVAGSSLGPKSNYDMSQVSHHGHFDQWLVTRLEWARWPDNNHILNFIPLWEWTWCHCVFHVRQDWNACVIVRLWENMNTTTKRCGEMLAHIIVETRYEVMSILWSGIKFNVKNICEFIAQHQCLRDLILHETANIRRKAQFATLINWK